MSTHTDTIIEGLAEAGFDPLGVCELFTDSDRAEAIKVLKTLDYFQPDAFRIAGDNLTLAWYRRDELTLTVMTLNGVTKATATFSDSELGVEMFLGAARVAL